MQSALSPRPTGKVDRLRRAVLSCVEPLEKRALLANTAPVVEGLGLVATTTVEDTPATIELWPAFQDAEDPASVDDNFLLTVKSVNDAPSFTKGPDQVVAEDSAPQTVPFWATAISPGPP